MSFEKIIQEVVSSFIHAFNKRDFENLKKILTPDFYLISDAVKQIYPENAEGKIAGSDNAIIFWEKMTRELPELLIEEGDFKITSNGKNIVYSGVLKDGKRFVSNFTMNEYAKIDSLVTKFPDLI